VRIALVRGEEGEWKKHQECCDISQDLSIRQLAIKTALRWGKSTRIIITCTLREITDWRNRLPRSADRG